MLHAHTTWLPWKAENVSDVAARGDPPTMAVGPLSDMAIRIDFKENEAKLC